MCGVYNKSLPVVTGGEPHVLFLCDILNKKNLKYASFVAKKIEIESFVAMGTVQCKVDEITKEILLNCQQWIKRLIEKYNISFIILLGKIPVYSLLDIYYISETIGKFYEAEDFYRTVCFMTYDVNELSENKEVFKKHLIMMKKYIKNKK